MSEVFSQKKNLSNKHRVKQRRERDALDGGVDSDFVLPLKVGPYAAEFEVAAVVGAQVLDNVCGRSSTKTSEPNRNKAAATKTRREKEGEREGEGEKREKRR